MSKTRIVNHPTVTSVARDIVKSAEFALASKRARQIDAFVGTTTVVDTTLVDVYNSKISINNQ